MSPTGLDVAFLDGDAVRAVERLQSHGYEAYLVGGCVRDLLLGHRPKDFDIATSARPAGVKRTFPRNCRIIGRRFKLAHLHFHGNQKILEVSTFRRAPEQQEEDDDEDLLITRDNEYGTAEEDAVRRDFTINALFYDPVRDEIVDHCGGLADLERRVVRTIGEPFVRFREDPVRILRAIKFAGRLGLTIDSDTDEAMRRVAPDLTRSAPPRLLEEILRLLRGQHALDAFQRLRDCGAMAAILPTVHEYLDLADRPERIRFWRMLEALDGRAARAASGSDAHWPPENGVLLGCLFDRPVQFAASRAPKRSPTGLAEELIAPFATDFRLPRRDTGCLKRICAVQHRFREDPDQQRYRTEAFLNDPYFAEALELFELASIAEGSPRHEVEAWSRRYRKERGRGSRTAHAEPDATSRDDRDDRGDDEGDRRGKRKRKRKRKNRGDDRPRHEEPRDDERRERDRKGDKRKKKQKEKPKERSRSGRDRKRERVETIEPEAVDLSAFDVELDPKRVPTFGTIVEGDARRRRRRVPASDQDDYRPPPPPADDGAPPPPPPRSEPDTFGDW